MKFITAYWPELLSITISCIALFVSIKSWRKTRAIYALISRIPPGLSGGPRG